MRIALAATGSQMGELMKIKEFMNHFESLHFLYVRKLYLDSTYTALYTWLMLASSYIAL
jgi:hypothetical protein